MSQALAKEGAHLNIHVLIAQPGALTTNMMNAGVLSSRGMSSHYKDSEAGDLTSLFHAGEAPKLEAGGDVEKGCQVILDVVTGTGNGVGKDSCIRLPLSVDCAKRTRGQIRSLQETNNVFKDIWENTGHYDEKKRAFPIRE